MVMETETYKETQQLLRTVLRTSKYDSMFLYFILESNEGLCYFSTLESSLGTSYRDIDIHCSIELKQTLLKVLEHIGKSIEFEVLLEETVKDSL